MGKKISTYSEEIRKAANRLNQAGIEGGLRDARRLMEIASNMSAVELIAAENELRVRWNKKVI